MQNINTVENLLLKVNEKHEIIGNLRIDLNLKKKQNRALLNHVTNLVTELADVKEKLNVLTAAQENLGVLNYTESNGVRTYTNFNIRLTSSNIEELNGIPFKHEKDSFYIGKLMGMIFTKEQLLLSSVTGRNSKNSKKNRIAQNPLCQTKLSFLSKMFSNHIAMDLENVSLHEIRLKKLTQNMSSKIQNVRKMARMLH